MRYVTHSFRYGEEIFATNESFRTLWNEIEEVIEGISDQDIIDFYTTSTRSSKKSLSESINVLIDNRLTTLGWNRQSPIFNESEYRPTRKSDWWTLDFAKEDISVEVAFNHGEAVAWNLIKPVLASELNHVEKAIQTRAGVIITATDALKKAGNFDGSAGTYEKFLQYLRPFNNILTVPMVIVGLQPPETFRINRKTRLVERINSVE